MKTLASLLFASTCIASLPESHEILFGDVEVQVPEEPVACEQEEPSPVILVDEEEVTPETGAPSYCVDRKDGHLRFFGLLGDKMLLPKDEVDGACGIDVSHVNLPGDPENLQTRIEPFLGEKITTPLLQQVRDAVIQYYYDQNRPVVLVEVPPQDITDGALQMVVTESTLNKVVVDGGKYFSDASYKKAIRLKQGEPIRSDILLNDIAFLNANPYRHVDVTLAPGSENNTTDIHLKVKDLWPFRIYVGGDNTGIRVTGYTRFFAGVTWANVFNMGHTFTYQGTTSDNFKSFYSHTINYIAPLRSRGTFIAYGGYSGVNPDISGFKTKGESFQASVRYQRPFGALAHGSLKELVVGIDYKQTNNNLVYNDDVTPFVRSNVNIFQLMLGFNYGLTSGRHVVSASAQGYGMPADFLPHQSEADFEALFPNAKNKYVYGRFSFMYTYDSPRGVSFYLMQRGQASSATLLPSEQFALGGYDTVRGYQERNVNGDNGYVVNCEFRSPKGSVVGLFGGKRKLQDQLMVYGFIDYGFASYINPPPGAVKLSQEMSVGPGLRYAIDPYLSFRFDWGFRLITTQFEDAFGSRAHIGVIVSY